MPVFSLKHVVEFVIYIVVAVVMFVNYQLSFSTVALVTLILMLVGNVINADDKAESAELSVTYGIILAFPLGTAGVAYAIAKAVV